MGNVCIRGASTLARIVSPAQQRHELRGQHELLTGIGSELVREAGPRQSEGSATNVGEAEFMG